MGIPFVVAYRWKCQINENAKQHAFCGEFPEMNHNEIEGWEGAIERSRKPCSPCADYAVFMIRSKTEHKRIGARMEILGKKLLADVGPKEVWLEGEMDLIRMMNGFNLGDYVSAYLAIFNRADPMKVEYIDRLKQRLGDIS